ncbi:SRPBCC family protein [Marinicellulosiphila megalodicopiae]|uniref:SRPBCC family protein n=1 Tax=Marinicellulosiphila megalodicopiae TaxID=2724896 RepID=UPI003BB11671
MKYKLITTIDRPIKEIFDLMINPEYFNQWQKTFIDYEVLSGKLAEQGCQTQLNYRYGKKILQMKETLLTIEAPLAYSVTYETDTVWNHVQNRFHKLSENKTQWTFETEFKCKGWLKIMAKIMPFIFKGESKKAMKSFKIFVESKQN